MTKVQFVIGDLYRCHLGSPEVGRQLSAMTLIWNRLEDGLDEIVLPRRSDWYAAWLAYGQCVTLN